MPVVAHCTGLYLHTHGAWLYAQIVHQRRYEPMVLAQDTANLDEFPVARLYAAAQLPGLLRMYNRLIRKATGEYPLYASRLKRGKAALIHAHFGYEGARCLRARRGSGLPMLTSFYGADASDYHRDPSWRRRYERLFAAGEAFLVEGSAMRQRLADCGCPVEKIRINHLGVDLTRLRFAERRASQIPRFLICAALREKKGVRYALDALARVRDQGWAFRLVVVGDGPERPGLEQQVRDLDLQDRIHMRGMLPYSQVIAELQQCDVLLQPSVTATDGDTEGGAPVILLDAQACGIPVVATHHADIPEYVRDGQSGLLAPERDAAALSDCILFLLRNPGAWGRLGAAGRLHVEQEYCARRQAERLEAIYDEFV